MSEESHNVSVAALTAIRDAAIEKPTMNEAVAHAVTETTQLLEDLAKRDGIESIAGLSQALADGWAEAVNT